MKNEVFIFLRLVGIFFSGCSVQKGAMTDSMFHTALGLFIFVALTFMTMTDKE